MAGNGRAPRAMQYCRVCQALIDNADSHRAHFHGNIPAADLYVTVELKRVPVLGYCLYDITEAEIGDSRDRPRISLIPLLAPRAGEPEEHVDYGPSYEHRYLGTIPDTRQTMAVVATAPSGEETTCGAMRHSERSKPTSSSGC
jgi:hypothetical protein